VLKDGEKRAAYDRFGHAAFEHGGVGAGGNFGADFGSAFSDLFRGIFGMAGSAGRSGRERGADLRYNMEISLDEALRARNAQIRIPTSVSCEACSGTGAKSGTKPKTCPTCGGAGRIRHAQGFFTLERTCPACQGRGQVIDSPCPSCSGAGRVTRERMLSVNIPAGVEDGHPHPALGAKARPGCGAGRPATSIFSCRSRRIRSFSATCRPALPGADLDGDGGARRRVEVPTIDGGKTRVKVPEGTQSGRRFRLQDKAMPVLRSKQSRGHVCQVVVETPQSLTKRQDASSWPSSRSCPRRIPIPNRRVFRQGQGVSRWRRGQPDRGLSGIALDP